MSLSNRARVSAYVVVAAYSILLAVFNVNVPTLLGKLATWLPLLVVACFAAFDKWLWRLGPVPGLVHRPDVRGIWIGQLTSYRRDEHDRPIQTQHDVALVIRQDFTTVAVTLLSAESKSLSSAAHIEQLQSDDFALMYQYQNTPRMKFRAGSPIHSGGSTIEICGIRPDSLTGEYWTARDTRGTYEVRRVSRGVAGTFDEAKRAGS